MVGQVGTERETDRGRSTYRHSHGPADEVVEYLYWWVAAAVKAQMNEHWMAGGRGSLQADTHSGLVVVYKYVAAQFSTHLQKR